MKSVISMMFVVLYIVSSQFDGWPSGIQFVYGEDKIDFSGITLSDSERKVIVEKAMNFYNKEHPVGPEEGMPIVGSEDTKNLKLGDALKIFHIRMDRIRNYQSGMKPEDVLFPAEGGIVAIYTPNQQLGDKSNILSFAPLILGGNEKSDGAKYKAGWPRNLPDYALLFKAWKEIEHEKTEPPFGIFYPATARYFLGYINENNEFKIKVLHDGPGNLKEGQNLSASGVFIELAKDAKKGQLEFEPSGNPLEKFRRFQQQQ